MRTLKPVLAAVCLIGLLPGSASGQGSTLGLKGGLNISTLRIEDSANPDLESEYRTGLVLGAFLECGGESWFALQGEVNYSQNGATVRAGNSVTELDLDYLRVPVLVMARLGPRGRTVYPLVYAGPQLAFEVGCRTKSQQDGVSRNSGCDGGEIGDGIQTRTVEFGLVFGGGVEYLLGGWKVELDGRYNLGLTNMNGGTNANSVSVENRGWTLAVGLGKVLR
jgi:hypothetical protein